MVTARCTSIELTGCPTLDPTMTWTSAQLRRLSLWLLCATLLAALAPTVSRARAWSQGSAVPWMAVCTTEGAQQTALNQQGNTQSEEGSMPGAAMLDHCALCVLASDRMAPPPNSLSWQGLPQAPPLLAQFDQHIPQAVPRWTVHTRAPPAHA
jgi:hypothetical protein